MNMARLGSDLKMGYYPTPPGALDNICRFLNIDKGGKIHALDPCCGEGEAIRYFASSFWNVTTHGVEPDGERFTIASEVLDQTIHGSIFDARINPLGSVGLLWLNPPYGIDEGERVEMKFLRHSLKWLCEDGVLVFIVPEHLFERERDRVWISVHFQKVRVFRFPRKEYPRFKQVVLFGVKREGSGEISPPPYPHIEDAEPDWTYLVPSTEEPTVFQNGRGVTLEEIEKFRPRLIGEIKKLMGFTNGFRMRPLLPLRRGHLVALLTAGMLDGKVETSDGGFILVKGFSDRVVTTWTDEEAGKEITKSTYSVGIRVMEEGGKWYDIR
jgi:hypothetical protein